MSHELTPDKIMQLGVGFWGSKTFLTGLVLFDRWLLVFQPSYALQIKLRRGEVFPTRQNLQLLQQLLFRLGQIDLLGKWLRVFQSSRPIHLNHVTFRVLK